jgi:hypothetical protein
MDPRSILNIATASHIAGGPNGTKSRSRASGHIRRHRPGTCRSPAVLVTAPVGHRRRPAGLPRCLAPRAAPWRPVSGGEGVFPAAGLIRCIRASAHTHAMRSSGAIDLDVTRAIDAAVTGISGAAGNFHSWSARVMTNTASADIRPGALPPHSQRPRVRQSRRQSRHPRGYQPESGWPDQQAGHHRRWAPVVGP